MALQLASPDPGDLMITLLEQMGRSKQTQSAPRVKYVGGQPSQSAADEIARRIREDQAAGKLDLVSGTAAGKAWFFGE